MYKNIKPPRVLPLGRIYKQKSEPEQNPARFFCRSKTVALFETIYASTGINQLLLAGEVGMAFGTNFNFQFLFCGTGCKCFAANTTDYSVTILRMYFFFHYISPLYACHGVLWQPQY